MADEQVKRPLQAPVTDTATLIKNPKQTETSKLFIFPKAVRLTTNDQKVYQWDAGPGHVPAELEGKPAEEHWWLKANGAKPYEGTVPLKWGSAKPAPEITERHVQFLQSRGYGVKTVDDAKAFVANLEPDSVSLFLADADRWASDVANGDAKIGAPDAEDDEESALYGLSKKALLDRAGELGLDLPANFTKYQIIKKIEAAEADNKAKEDAAKAGQTT